MENSNPTLVIFTALTATAGERSGSFVLTKKFLEGVMEYAQTWPGAISVWVQLALNPDNNLDHVEIHPDDLPFRLNWILGTSEARFTQGIKEADLVLAALVPQHIALADMCKERSVPLVYITEYSENTRRQIVRAETRNPLLRWRREHWAASTEKRYCRAVKLAAGVQCNGTPTYAAYKELNPRPLLYFDTRVRSEQIIESSRLKQRLAVMRNGGAIRLAFSGRLIAMKGADHLPIVAKELQRLGVPFTMDICGGGDLEPLIRNDIRRLGLESQVRMRGVLDFERELLPHIANDVDLFVCCHRQGDPSCTYLETYSCGVPIVGYSNEAFSGLAELSNVGGMGWVTPMDNPTVLAHKIAELSTKQAEIEAASCNAIEFSLGNSFEITMKKRVKHMVNCIAGVSGSTAIKQQNISNA